MIKTNKKNNKLKLIKKNNLLKLIKEEGINRVSPNALNALDKKISKNVKNLIRELKQHIQINAKKTLEEKDILTI